jgi:YfiH family protein
MEMEGFQLDRQGDQPILRYLFPPVFCGFSATLYLKGALMEQIDVSESVKELLSPELPLVMPRQVHGTNILLADPSCSLPERREADGVAISRSANVAVALQFADCWPVILGTPTPEPRFLLLHCGFKGAVSHFVTKALSWARKEWSADGKDIWAWLGPGIGPCCYARSATGDLWTKRAFKSFPSRAISRSSGKSVNFDIASAIKVEMWQCGLVENQIFILRDCTSCNSDVFYSYRKGDAGRRMILLAFFA